MPRLSLGRCSRSRSAVTLATRRCAARFTGVPSPDAAACPISGSRIRPARLHRARCPSLRTTRLTRRQRAVVGRPAARAVERPGGRRRGAGRAPSARGWPRALRRRRGFGAVGLGRAGGGRWPRPSASPSSLSTWRRNWPVWLSGHLGDLLGRAGGEHQAALVAALRTHVDQPVGRLDHVEVVLDDDHRVALVDQALAAPSAACGCPRSAGRWSARRARTRCGRWSASAARRRA